MIVKVKMFGIPKIGSCVVNGDVDGESLNFIECKRVINVKTSFFNEMLQKLNKFRLATGDDDEVFFNHDHVLMSSRESFQSARDLLFEADGEGATSLFPFTEFTIEDKCGKIITYLIHGMYNIYFMENGVTFDTRCV